MLGSKSYKVKTKPIFRGKYQWVIACVFTGEVFAKGTGSSRTDAQARAKEAKEKLING
jgi:dsRNA-specific ribonuclease